MKEFDWKVKMRYFNTPHVISAYVNEPSVALQYVGENVVKLEIMQIFGGIALRFKNSGKVLKKRNRQNNRGRDTSRSSGMYNEEICTLILLLIAKKT